MKLLAFPRDPNPYQRLLYGEMQRLGAMVSYIGDLTPSRTLNLLLLPLEVTVRRLGGARLVHVHWVFTFALPGTERFPILRKGAFIWFVVWLRTCRMVGVHIVWTAHNVMPHAPVFADDVAARRALVAASDIVLAHSSSALAELAALGAPPRRSAVVQHGPIISAHPDCELAHGRTPGEARRFLFFGRVREYKGVEDLLAAFAALPAGVPAHLTVAGQCDDPRLRARLEGLAREDSARILLCLERISEDDVAALLAAADVVVLPFRRVTTSGSAVLALSHGRPLVVPNLAGLADLPDRAVLRYDGRVASLARVMTDLARADHGVLAAMSAAARGYASTLSWHDIAQATMAHMISVLSPAESDAHNQPLPAP